MSLPFSALPLTTKAAYESYSLESEVVPFRKVQMFDPSKERTREEIQRDEIAEKLRMGTPEERAAIITSLRSPKSTEKCSAWTRRSLALLGVTWPPKKGWRTRLIETGRP